jgi:prepilin peptidase dependent protein B
MPSAQLQPMRKAHSQRGLSIVEFMVGVAIGLFVVGGAIKVFVDLFNNNRRQLVEVRLNQDLRAAADIIARDLRRSGYWENSMLGVAPAATAASNPFANTEVTTVAANQVTYAYDRDRDGALTPASEQTGFRLTGNVIEMRVGGNWQQLTDPNSILITAFTIDNAASATETFSSAKYCPCNSASPPCDPAVIAAGASAPMVVKRVLEVTITGQAPNDPSTTRRILERVRLRNDEVRGVCP